MSSLGFFSLLFIHHSFTPPPEGTFPSLHPIPPSVSYRHQFFHFLPFRFAANAGGGVGWGGRKGGRGVGVGEWRGPITGAPRLIRFDCQSTAQSHQAARGTNPNPTNRPTEPWNGIKPLNHRTPSASAPFVSKVVVVSAQVRRT